MQRIAVSVWHKRISPVFDVSRKILVCDIEAGAMARQVEEQIPEDNPARKAARLRDLGVNTLICGAISRPLADMLSAGNIHLICFVTGEVKGVLDAFIKGRLTHGGFTMPGCRQRRRGWPGGPGKCRTTKREGLAISSRGARFTESRKEDQMPRKDGSGPRSKGSGTGRGRGPCAQPGAAGPRRGQGGQKGSGRGRRGCGQGQAARQPENSGNKSNPKSE
jgi:predicted Fe-Mo cluster-binding NifX family protein